MVLTPLPLPPSTPATTTGGGENDRKKRGQPHDRHVRGPRVHNAVSAVGPEFLYQGGLNEAFRLLKSHYIHIGFLDFCDCSRFMKALCEAAVTSADNILVERPRQRQRQDGGTTAT